MGAADITSRHSARFYVLGGVVKLQGGVTGKCLKLGNDRGTRG